MLNKINLLMIENGSNLAFIEAFKMTFSLHTECMTLYDFVRTITFKTLTKGGDFI